MARGLINFGFALILLHGCLGGALAACPHTECDTRAAAHHSAPRRADQDSAHCASSHAAAPSTNPARHANRAPQHDGHAAPNKDHAPSHGDQVAAHDRHVASHDDQAAAREAHAGREARDGGRESVRVARVSLTAVAGGASCAHCVGSPEAPPARASERQARPVKSSADSDAPHAVFQLRAAFAAHALTLRPAQHAPPGRPGRHLLLSVFRI